MMFLSFVTMHEGPSAIDLQFTGDLRSRRRFLPRARLRRTALLRAESGYCWSCTRCLGRKGSSGEISRFPP